MAETSVVIHLKCKSEYNTAPFIYGNVYLATTYGNEAEIEQGTYPIVKASRQKDGSWVTGPFNTVLVETDEPVTITESIPVDDGEENDA